jgi:hypothetical protein
LTSSDLATVPAPIIASGRDEFSDSITFNASGESSVTSSTFNPQSIAADAILNA